MDNAVSKQIKPDTHAHGIAGNDNKINSENAPQATRDPYEETISRLIILFPNVNLEVLKKALQPINAQCNRLKIELNIAQKDATTDMLTGLPNKRVFDVELNKAVNLVRRRIEGNAGRGHQAKQEFEKNRDVTQRAIVFIDIVGLTAINKMGHSAGDASIIATADALRQIIRKDEVACRVGGDEFALIMVDRKGNPLFKDEAKERFDKAFEGLTFEYEGIQHPVKIYVAPFEIKGDLDATTTYRIAGEYLAEAKIQAGLGREASNNIEKNLPDTPS